MALSAKIKEIRASGVVVELSDGRPAWLPAREIYPDIKPHQDFRARAKCLIGTELAVVEFQGVGTGRPLVSHVRATNDPWKSVATWDDGQIKVMEVIAGTRGGAIGIIPPGIRASVQLPGGKALLPPSWKDFAFPLPGDEVAGYFRREHVNTRIRIVTLDFEGYVRSHVSLNQAPVLTSDSGSPVTVAMAALSPVSEMIDGARRNALRRIGPTLIVDDDEAFLESLNRFMTDFGCQVRPCNSYDDARQLLQTTEEVFELAILDLHLKNANDFLGLDLAGELALSQPNCRIVLISGDNLDRNSEVVSKHAWLPVAGFVTKPLGIDDLVDALAHAAHVTTLGEYLSSRPRGPVLPEPTVDSSYEDDLEAACESLRETIGAESVVLFSIDPVSYEVRIEARSDPANLVTRVHHHLDRSPVRDAAIDGEVIFTGHASGPDDGKKHSYLERAYGYESCIGVPVALRPGHSIAYALFAFHRVRDGFIPHDKYSVKLAAESVTWILRAETLRAELRHMKPFELMGKVYGSMAHDLRSTLPDGPMLANLLKDIGTGNASAAEQTALSIRDRNERARGIVETFRRMASGQHDEVTDFPLPAAVAESVRTFAKSHHLESRCSMAPYVGPPCRVHMRRSGLHQIVYNLLLNAAQQIARLRGLRAIEEEILVEVQYVLDETSGDWALVLVHDNGPGIHKRDFERVFDIHYTTKEGGCGMGLDICRSIARSVRRGERIGSVRVRSSILLAGTTFEIQLPL